MPRKTKAQIEAEKAEAAAAEAEASTEVSEVETPVEDATDTTPDDNDTEDAKSSVKEPEEVTEPTATAFASEEAKTFSESLISRYGKLFRRG